MRLYNENEIMKQFDELDWDLAALLDEAETWATTCTDRYGDDFVYEDKDGYYYFDLLHSGTVEVTVEKDGDVLVDRELYARWELKDKVYARYANCDIDIEEVDEPLYTMRMYLK